MTYSFEPFKTFCPFKVTVNVSGTILRYLYPKDKLVAESSSTTHHLIDKNVSILAE